MSGDSQDKSWKAKAWNIVFLLVGAMIAFVGNSLERIWERAEERSSLSAIFRSDIEYQVEVMNALSTGLGNLKSGKFPNVAPGAPTLDSSMQRSGKKVEATFPVHKSIVLEANLPKLYLLDSKATSDILRFYSNLADCEVKRVECQNALHARVDERHGHVESPSPVCDIYLDSMKMTVATGRRALANLGKKP